jgi:hypothetical protein
MCSIRGMRRHSASGRPRRHVSFFDIGYESFFDIGYEPMTLPTRPSNPLTDLTLRSIQGQGLPAPSPAGRSAVGSSRDTHRNTEGDVVAPEAAKTGQMIGARAGHPNQGPHGTGVLSFRWAASTDRVRKSMRQVQ